MKTITDTLGLARSNIADRLTRARPKRGPQNQAGDLELIADIRRLVNARPTYGYRRIAALLKRERRSDGMATVNAKRIYRLMKRHGLLLARQPAGVARANMTARSPRCAPISAGARTASSSPAGTVRSFASPLRSIATTVRSSAG
jgi:transposase InsO family protein